MNEQIRAKEVRLIDETGQPCGVVSIEDATRLANSVGLDLIEISAQAKPPVVKIVDYGKFKYDQTKREKEAKKKQRAAQIETKELRYRPSTDPHDIEIMLKQAEKFLKRGDRVKFCIRTRGRESARLREFVGSMEATVSALDIKYVSKPQITGRQVTCVVERNND